jgi:hypothetical protein
MAEEAEDIAAAAFAATTSTTICLSSDASVDIFPTNDATAFVNRLPRTLTNMENRKFHLKLKAIAMTTRSADPARITSGLARVHIYEVEGQRRGLEYRQNAGGFAFPPSEWRRGNYGLHTFSSPVRLPLRFQTLDKLHVLLTDDQDRKLELHTGPPTLLWVELTDSEMEPEEEFTITAVSSQPDLFPGNRLANFTMPLQSELSLVDYEVALLHLVYPPLMTEDATAALTVNGTRLTFDMNEFVDNEDFVQTVNDRLGELTENRLRFGVSADPRFDGQAYLLRGGQRRGDDLHADFHIYPSPTFTKACGQTSHPRARTVLRPGKMFLFEGRPNIHLGRPHPLAMLECGLLNPNIVCGRLAPLLQCVPVLARREHNLARMYEPQQLTYHPVPQRPFTTINFRFTDPDGTPRDFRSTDPHDGMLITLSFRKRRPKK